MKKLLRIFVNNVILSTQPPRAKKNTWRVVVKWFCQWLIVWIQLIRKLLVISPDSIPKSLILSLVAIVNCSSKSDIETTSAQSEKRHTVARDRLYRACIEIICEIAFVAPLLVIHVGGFRALLGSWSQTCVYRRFEFLPDSVCDHDQIRCWTIRSRSSTRTYPSRSRYLFFIWSSSFQALRIST